jgi:hypothetical protein
MHQYLIFATIRLILFYQIYIFFFSFDLFFCIFQTYFLRFIKEKTVIKMFLEILNLHFIQWLLQWPCFMIFFNFIYFIPWTFHSFYFLQNLLVSCWCFIFLKFNLQFFKLSICNIKSFLVFYHLPSHNQFKMWF